MLPVTDFSDLRQSPAWSRSMKSLGWEVEKLDHSRLYIKKLVFGRGSLVKMLRPSPPVSFKKIDYLAKKHQAWFVKLEPRITIDNSHLTVSDLKKHGFYPSSWPLSPSKTIQIDLRQSKNKLFTDFKKETRSIIRKAEKKSVLINQSKEIEQFSDLWVKSMRRKGNLLSSEEEIKKIWEAFEKDVYLFLAYLPTNKSQPLAGLLMLVFDRVGYYFSAASTQEGNQLGAPSLLVYRAILLAKKLGCQVFDLDGVYDPRYHQATKNWQGFTKFKKGFGGEEVDFLGSFIKGYGFLKKLRWLISHL